MELCSYGCGQEGKFQFKNGKRCCCESKNSCPENKLIGIKHPLFEKKHLNSSKEKMSISHKKENLSIKSLENMGRSQKERFKKEEEKEKNRRRMKNLYENTNLREIVKNKTKEAMDEYYKKNPDKYKDLKEKARKQCLNGHSHYMLKHVKNPSTEEIILRKIIKDICPESENTYKVLSEKNYSLDNAIVKYKIAIEFDGYFHFCDQKHIDYHKRRQEEIEERGWKFLRYTIFDKFPTKERVKEDIERMMNYECDLILPS